MDLATRIKYPADQMIECTGILDWQMAQVVLAMKFDALPESVKMQAIFEEWDQERIVRECY